MCVFHFYITYYTLVYILYAIASYYHYHSMYIYYRDARSIYTVHEFNMTLITTCVFVVNRAYNTTHASRTRVLHVRFISLYIDLAYFKYARGVHLKRLENFENDTITMSVNY